VFFLFLQNWMDPLHPDTAVREWCAAHGVLYTSYSTLGTQHHSQDSNNPVLTHPVIVEIAKKHQVSPALVVLSWALQEGVAVIPRSSNPAHIKELAKLLPEDVEETENSGLPVLLRTFLTDAEVQSITALGEGEGQQQQGRDEL
jgi:diketogulonate reductase-like aldo/keto reductase